MTLVAQARLAWLGAGLLALAGLSGCATSTLSGTAGVVAGTVGGAASANPAVGLAVGITVQAVADASIKAVLRGWTHEQQVMMAQVAGALPIGVTHPWEVKRMLSIGNEQGELQVVREIDNALVRCREVAFSVKDGEAAPPRHYLTQICHYGNQWQWASADPAVSRWQGLQ